jgi:hypothetical protein
MTDPQQQHRATPEQWETLEHYVIAIPNPSIASCILELRNRVKALEAGQTCPHIVTSDEGTSYCALAEQTANQFRDPTEKVAAAAPADSLVERVADAIVSQATSAGIVDDRPARAAIREVASWLRSEPASRAVADRLEQESER